MLLLECLLKPNQIDFDQTFGGSFFKQVVNGLVFISTGNPGRFQTRSHSAMLASVNISSVRTSNLSYKIA